MGVGVVVWWANTSGFCAMQCRDAFRQHRLHMVHCACRDDVAEPKMEHRFLPRCDPKARGRQCGVNHRPFEGHRAGKTKIINPFPKAAAAISQPAEMNVTHRAVHDRQRRRGKHVDHIRAGFSIVNNTTTVNSAASANCTAKASLLHSFWRFVPIIIQTNFCQLLTFAC